VESDILIVIGSALAAAISFIAFAFPFLQKSDKKDHYRSVIEKRKKDLFEQARSSQGGAVKKSDAMSARDSMAMSFKMQEMLGEMGEKLRDKMLQAGYRNPSAPIKFMVTRIVAPFVLMGFTMIILAGSDKEISNQVEMFILLGAMIVGYAVPGLLLKSQIQKRSQEINLSFPDALDMMLICILGGIGLEQTVDRISEEIVESSPTLAEELGILTAEMAMLGDRRVALQDFARRVGSGAAKSFANALIQAEQYGTSVSTAMRVMSDELRDERMAAAEQKAASLPPKLTVPMILFFLPVLFVIIIGPVVLKFQSL
jgi:tight adherence protein C